MLIAGSGNIRVSKSENAISVNTTGPELRLTKRNTQYQEVMPGLCYWNGSSIGANERPLSHPGFCKGTFAVDRWRIIIVQA